MFKNQLLICLIPVIFISCSTSLSDYFNKKEKTGKRNEELIKSFEGEEEVFKKFKEEVKVVEVEEVVKSKTVKNKVKKTSLKIKNAIKKKKKKEKIVEKIIIKKSRYPKDFPEEFKTLDKESLGFWSSFKPRVFEGEEIYMDINYGGLSTGKVALTTMPRTKLGGQDVYHFHARVKTSSYYSYLYELDDNIDSYIDPKTFTPVKYSLIQRESGQNIDDLQLFDKDELKTYTFYKRETKKKTKKNKATRMTPIRFQDPLSILYFLRGLPFEIGKNYSVPIMNKGEVLMLNARAEKVETIDTEIGDIEAIKVIASTKYTGETLKSGDMTFWFSSDERRIFLRFKAKIKIGSISGDIEKYER